MVVVLVEIVIGPAVGIVVVVPAVVAIDAGWIGAVSFVVFRRYRSFTKRILVFREIEL